LDGVSYISGEDSLNEDGILDFLSEIDILGDFVSMRKNKFRSTIFLEMMYLSNEMEMILRRSIYWEVMFEIR